MKTERPQADRRPMCRKRWLWITVGLLALGAVLPSYVRICRVRAGQMLQSFPVGDHILVNKAAYDLRFPYSARLLWSHSEPERGDVVLFRAPREGYLVFKRVVGCPGDTVMVRGSQLAINGVALRYESVDADEFEFRAEQNRLGRLIEREIGKGPSHLIARNPNPNVSTSESVLVPENGYYVLGDNREYSEDSRTYGPISRTSILGRVIRAYHSDPGG